MSNGDSNEALLKEYGECWANWRFIVGLRFTVLAYFLTLNSGLLYVCLKGIGENAHPLVKWVPVLGLLSVVAAWVIENRNKQMYYACIQRVKAIEANCGYLEHWQAKIRRVWWWTKFRNDVEDDAEDNCIGHLLDNRCPVRLSSSQTWGIRLLYLGFVLAWVVLFAGNMTGFWIGG